MSNPGFSQTSAGDAASLAWAPEQESMFQQVMAKLRQRSRRGWTALLLVASVGAFLLVESSDGSFKNVLVVTGVLAFHEAGHFLAMQLFGYRDVTMFFVPFLGAAVSGKRAGSAAWKEALVLLAGPVPGIVVGAIMLLTAREGLSPAARGLALTLLFVNGFNLLPLVPLDGGRLIELVLLGARRELIVPFQVAAAVALSSLSVKLHFPALHFLAFVMAIGSVHRRRLLRAAAEVRKSGIPVPGDARELDGETGRRVFAAARDVAPGFNRDHVGFVASTLDELVDLVSNQRPTFAAGAAFLVAWVLSFVLVALGIAARSLPIQEAPAEWTEVTEPIGGWSARFPRRPSIYEVPMTGRAPSIRVKLPVPKGAGYLVMSDPVTWRDPPLATMAHLLQKVDAKHPGAPLLAGAVRTEVTFAGENAVRFDYKRSFGDGTAIMLEHGGRRFLIVGDGRYRLTFLESFRWTPATAEKAP